MGCSLIDTSFKAIGATSKIAAITFILVLCGLPSEGLPADFDVPTFPAIANKTPTQKTGDGMSGDASNDAIMIKRRFVTFKTLCIRTPT